MFEAPDPKELTNLLSGYDVTDLIAVGGMGAVYRAQQISLGRDVAVKVLPRELSQVGEFAKSFRAEAKVMARLQHPNLIGVHDFGEVEGFLYLIMDFVDGKSLHHSAHGKVIDQEEAVRLVHGICDGVAHAHEEGIIHRDIKPANILLDSNKQPRIGDFGLARPADGSEGEGMHFGTPEYTAPEIIKDPGNADKRSDVFAIGVLLYELLTGELPGESYVPPSQVQKVDPRFDKIVRRAMHPASEMRFADAGEMAKELETLRNALATPGSKLLTKKTGTESSPAKLSAGDEAAGPDPAAAKMAAAATEAHKRSLVRNLIIIAVLLVIIPIVWNAYKRKKTTLANQIEQAERDKAAKKPDNALANPPVSSGKTPPNRPSQPDRPSRPAPERDPIPPRPVEITLGELQDSLAGGDRTRFPTGHWDWGDQKAYLVAKRLNWREACRFAEEHGGYLATIADEAAMTALGAKLPKDSAIWLGGGLTGPSTWGWIDGTPWALSSSPAETDGRFLSLTSSGTVASSSGEARYPFVILWHPSGDNPGAIDAQLKRVKESLEQPDPLYPPGTLSNKNRRYLILEEKVAWDEAAVQAREAGGYLAVPSDEEENKFLQDALAKTLSRGSAAWIGGRFQTGAWTWVTGEPWTFNAWTTKPLHALESHHVAVRLVNAAESGWDNVSPETVEAAAGFVIEWSDDHLDAADPAPAAPALDLAALKRKAAASIAGKKEKHAELLLDNGTRMQRDLVDWLTNALHARARARYRAAIQAAQQKVQPTGRISSEGTFPALPADIGEACNRRIETQRKLDAQIEKSVEKDRAAYLEKINAALEAAQDARILDQIEILGAELKAVGEDTQAFFRYLSLE